jgi:hypothetical protein
MPPKFQRFIDSGFIFQGRMRLPSGYVLYAFTYTDGYTNSDGVFTKYMPTNKVLVASSDARCDRFFGPDDKLPPTDAKIQMYRQYFGLAPNAAPVPMNVKNAGAIIMPEVFFADAYEDGNEGKAVTLRTQTAPIFATTATDGFVTMTVLAA